MSETILKINDLKVELRRHRGRVKGISFDVPAGQIVTLIGANGAGKSSTLRTIAGLCEGSSGGSIEFEGENITGLDPDLDRVKGHNACSRRPQDIPWIQPFFENLKIGAYLRRDDLTDDLNWVYDLFSETQERSWQGRYALRRRAADACSRQSADEPSRSHYDGRTLPWRLRRSSCAASLTLSRDQQAWCYSSSNRGRTQHGVENRSHWLCPLKPLLTMSGSGEGACKRAGQGRIPRHLMLI